MKQSKLENSAYGTIIIFFLRKNLKKYTKVLLIIMGYKINDDFYCLFNFSPVTIYFLCIKEKVIIKIELSHEKMINIISY